MGRRPKQTFFPRKHTDGQKAHEKMLNFTHFLRNANQNYYISQNGNHKKSTNNKCWRGCGEIVGGNVNW